MKINSHIAVHLTIGDDIDGADAHAHDGLQIICVKFTSYLNFEKKVNKLSAIS